jgi:cob(I)alamin adenosyltransferase
MKISTKTGDSGKTGLWGGMRVDKDALRVQAYGTVDECNAAIGIARAFGSDPELDQLLAGIQNTLFVVGSDLTAIEDSLHNPRIQRADCRHSAVAERLDGGTLSYSISEPRKAPGCIVSHVCRRQGRLSGIWGLLSKRSSDDRAGCTWSPA